MTKTRETPDLVSVYVTTPDEELARELGRTLVGEGLAACVNVVPGVTAIYSWEGEVCEDPEVILFIKTRAHRLKALSERVAALHPYDVPAIMALPLVGGYPPYLEWVASLTE